PATAPPSGEITFEAPPLSYRLYFEDRVDNMGVKIFFEQCKKYKENASIYSKCKEAYQKYAQRASEAEKLVVGSDVKVYVETMLGYFKELREDLIKVAEFIKKVDQDTGNELVEILGIESTVSVESVIKSMKLNAKYLFDIEFGVDENSKRFKFEKVEFVASIVKAGKEIQEFCNEHKKVLFQEHKQLYFKCRDAFEGYMSSSEQNEKLNSPEAYISVMALRLEKFAKDLVEVTDNLVKINGFKQKAFELQTSIKVILAFTGFDEEQMLKEYKAILNGGKPREASKNKRKVKITEDDKIPGDIVFSAPFKSMRYYFEQSVDAQVMLTVINKVMQYCNSNKLEMLKKNKGIYIECKKPFDVYNSKADLAERTYIAPFINLYVENMTEAMKLLVEQLKDATDLISGQFNLDGMKLKDELKFMRQNCKFETSVIIDQMYWAGLPKPTQNKPTTPQRLPLPANNNFNKRISQNSNQPDSENKNNMLVIFGPTILVLLVIGGVIYMKKKKGRKY
ncbi:hypothetical protein ROZALSC1DRAFT_31762, partial [Rozella allomycis CSF55]